jgi:hypothetical protein
MGESESAAILEVLKDQSKVLGGDIKAVGQALESSRRERQSQIESVRTDMKDGFAVLHKRVSDSDKRLRALEIAHAANIGRCGGNDWLKDLGGIDGNKRRVTGLVALALVALAGVCILKWGPDLVHAIMR